MGVDEKNDFAKIGIYDAQDLQKHVAEQCEQMEQKVRPLFMVASKEGKPLSPPRSSESMSKSIPVAIVGGAE